MTALSLMDVQTSVASGSIAGVKTIYTSANAPVEVFTRDCPCMLPDPVKPLESSQNFQKSWKGAGFQRQRTYNYVVLICEAGTGRRPAEAGSALSTVIDAVENYLCDWDNSAAVSVGPVTITSAGVLQDATGKQFIGFTVALQVMSQY